MDAAVFRPAEGWVHKGATPLGELFIGKVVAGEVTNVLSERVWLNIGAEKDASFWCKGHSFKVGDSLSGLAIDNIDLKKGYVILLPPAANEEKEGA